MGISSSCELNLTDDACEIHKCLTSVVGLPSNSNSPSDTWILNMNATYDGIPIQTAFLKFFINPETIYQSENAFCTRNSCRFKTEVPIGSLKALHYEVRVYRDVIRPLLDANICPHFIKYLGGATECTFLNLYKMLLKNGDDDASKRNAVKGLLRSVLYMRLRKPNRPAITQSTTISLLNGYDLFSYSEEKESVKNALVEMYPTIGTEAPYHHFLMFDYFESVKKNLYTYAFIINEAVPANTVNFKVFFQQQGRTLTPSVWGVLFQIMVGCYTMFLSRLAHNDLHDMNVMVEPLPTPQNFKYIINGTLYELQNQYYIAKIFDFDHAYTTKLGDRDIKPENKMIVPNKDAIKFLSYVLSWLPSDQTATLANIYIKGKDTRKTNEWVRLIKNQATKQPVTIEVSRYNELYEPHTIINNYSVYFAMTHPSIMDVHKNPNSVEGAHVIHEDMFEQENVQKIQKLEQALEKMKKERDDCLSMHITPHNTKKRRSD